MCTWYQYVCLVLAGTTTPETSIFQYDDDGSGRKKRDTRDINDNNFVPMFDTDLPPPTQEQMDICGETSVLSVPPSKFQTAA